MSGRPANPSYSVRTWATDTNYGAGAEVWSSQPIKVEPPGPAGGFVPNQGAGAPYVNKLFNDAYTQDANAKTELQKILDYIGQIPALNFLGGVAENCNCAAWNGAENLWYFGQDTAVIKASSDFGQTVGADVVPGTPGTNDIAGIFVDPAGNMIALSDTGDEYLEWNHGTSTWTNCSSTGFNVLGPLAGDGGAMAVWDPTTSRWIAGGVNTSTNVLLAYSTDRQNWTASTGTPANGGNYARGKLAINPSTGRIVFICRASSTLKTSTSTNGGTSFTNQSDVAIGFSATHTSLAFDADSGLFVLVMSTNSSAGTTKTYTSTDGTSWTLKSALSAACVSNVQVLGDLWMGLNQETSIPAFSCDKGVTWKSTNFGAVTGGFESLAAGNGQFVIMGTAKVYVGLRAGDGSGPALT